MPIHKLSNEFLSPEFLENPGELLTRLRSEGPMVRATMPIIGNVWLTTNQSSAAEILKNHQIFAQRRKDGKVPGLQWWMPRSIKLLAGNMLTADEPDHTRLRQIVDDAFHRRSVTALTPHLRQLAGELCETISASGSHFDLVTEFARTLPLMVISELLGLEDRDRDRFLQLAGRFSNLTGMLGLLSAFPLIGRLNRHLEKQINKARTSDGAGLITELVRAQQSGAEISDDELLAMVFLLLVAGHETTTHLISGAVWALLTNPDQKRLLLEDWDRLDLAVEEFLRFISPVMMTKPRYCHEEISIQGIEISSGEMVMPCILAANHDPELFEHPEELDITRKPNRHMAFGTGIHFCLGHQLARLECAIAIQTLFGYFPELRFKSAPVWSNRLGMRAFSSMPVTI